MNRPSRRVHAVFRSGSIQRIREYDSNKATQNWHSAPGALKFKFDELCEKFSDEQFKTALGSRTIQQTTFTRLMALPSMLGASDDKTAREDLYDRVFGSSLLPEH